MQLGSRLARRSLTKRCVSCRPGIAKRRFQLSASKSGLQIPDKITKVSPKGDFVYVKCDPEEVKTLGGILLPGSAARKPTSGTVMDLGDGRIGQKDNYKFFVKKGDSVLYSKFGFAYTELTYKEEDYLLIKEDEVIGIMPKPNPIADDVVELKPLSDRVLVKVDRSENVTSGGVMLPDSAKERPLSGVVVRTGPGKRKEDGSIEKPKVKKGDKVLYFKYAGEQMETTKGDEFVVLRQNDILCKA
eukprot:g503.t1